VQVFLPQALEKIEQVQAVPHGKPREPGDGRRAANERWSPQARQDGKPMAGQDELKSKSRWKLNRMAGG
jgi:hypothetical protein